ncbi:MAG: ribbon-helix-helix domain-containing protein [Acetobacter sp.]|nr:ribbon-helix-helix domain-containing protein [Acetobacter sp.]
MTLLTNRVICINERKTSIRLAAAEWKAIDAICKKENMKRKKLFEIIDINRDKKLGLTPSIRLFTLIYYQDALLKKQQKDKPSILQHAIFEAVRKII